MSFQNLPGRLFFEGIFSTSQLLFTRCVMHRLSPFKHSFRQQIMCECVCLMLRKTCLKAIQIMFVFFLLSQNHSGNRHIVRMCIFLYTWCVFVCVLSRLFLQNKAPCILSDVSASTFLGQSCINIKSRSYCSSHLKTHFFYMVLISFTSHAPRMKSVSQLLEISLHCYHYFIQLHMQERPWKRDER